MFVTCGNVIMNLIFQSYVTNKSSLTEHVSVCFRSKVFLEIDNRQCSQHSIECISSADQAAAFIAAEYLKSELPYPLHSVSSSYTTIMHSLV